MLYEHLWYLGFNIKLTNYVLRGARGIRFASRWSTGLGYGIITDRDRWTSKGPYPLLCVHSGCAKPLARPEVLYCESKTDFAFV